MAESTEALNKMARMEHAGVPHKEIAAVFNLTEGRISQLFATPEFLIEIANVQNEDFEKTDMLNRGWDGVEEAALPHVIEHLQRPFCDEDYALKAAVMANKAQRRGKHVNNPIQVNAARQTIITLNAQFVNHLQTAFDVKERVVEELPKKATNMMSVTGVKKVLGIKKSTTVISMSDKDLVEDAIEEVQNA